MSIINLIDSVVKCVKCGKGMKECKCWEKCKCGWLKDRGKKDCNNPECTLFKKRNIKQ